MKLKMDEKNTTIKVEIIIFIIKNVLIG